MMTAMAARQPNVLAINAESHCQAFATISTGGAAYEVKVPPIEIFTNSTPRAPYLSHSGMFFVKTCGASMSAASVIAAGSVMNEPSNGTKARLNHTWASNE